MAGKRRRGSKLAQQACIQRVPTSLKAASRSQAVPRAVIPREADAHLLTGRDSQDASLEDAGVFDFNRAAASS